MNKLTFTGTVAGISRKEFEGKTNTKLQFIVESGDEIKPLNIKVLPEHDSAEVSKGSIVQFDVTASTMKDSFDVFYKTASKVMTKK